MHSEVIQLEGHIIDSNTLGRVLDEIYAFGARFRILEVHVGRHANERSFASIEISTDDFERLATLLAQLARYGAIWPSQDDAQFTEADIDGAFPEGFYSTTNHETLVRVTGRWVPVGQQEMDCGLRFDPQAGTITCVPMVHVRRGDRIVVGERGIKVVLGESERERGHFEFMSSEVTSEKPKPSTIRRVAELMHAARGAGQKIVLVGGPAIVHTDATAHVVKLIERGYVQVLFAGNALATHDIESQFFGTSLGVYLDKGSPSDTGHQHHLRAINSIRRCGGIRAAVASGLLTGGIMHACVKYGTEFVLAGSVRDDGPLPEVVTDVLVAQDRMRAALPNVGFVLMVATMLHSIATSNLLPASIPIACIDISAATLTKLSDRGGWQTIGVVTDVEPFFRELLEHLETLERAAIARAPGKLH